MYQAILDFVRFIQVTHSVAHGNRNERWGHFDYQVKKTSAATLLARHFLGGGKKKVLICL